MQTIKKSRHSKTPESKAHPITEYNKTTLQTMRELSRLCAVVFKTPLPPIMIMHYITYTQQDIHKTHNEQCIYNAKLIE